MAIHTIATAARERSKGPDWLAQNALRIGLVILVIYFTLRIPGTFATVSNFQQIAISSAILLIVASTQAVLVLMGYVDLSVGSTLALSGVITGMLINDGVPAAVALVVALVVGGLVGAAIGLLSVNAKLSPIIITLGAMTLLRGATQLLTDNPPTGFGSTMAFLGRGSIASVPISVLLAVLVLLIVWVFIARMPAGRHVYAIGVNADAAYLSGIRVRLIPTLAYIASGMSAALGGILYAARLDSAPPGSLGVGFEFDVLTAVLLGGIAFTGGRGTIGGVLVGVLFLGVLQNGMLLLNVSAYWQAVASGLALVVAAVLDRFANRQRVTRRNHGRPTSKQLVGKQLSASPVPAPDDVEVKQ